MFCLRIEVILSFILHENDSDELIFRFNSIKVACPITLTMKWSCEEPLF